jgi:hypothetical protein
LKNKNKLISAAQLNAAHALLKPYFQSFYPDSVLK